MRSSIPLKTEGLTWAVAGIVLGGCLAIPTYSAPLFDDAYIHARLAEHLLEDGAPLFNPGVSFKTGSSTGYLFILAAISREGSVVASIRALQALVIITTTASLLYLAAVSATFRVLKLIAALSVIPLFLWAAYGGMETTIACLSMTCAAIAWRHQKPALVVFSIAVGTWFRFEVIGLLLLILYYYLYVNRAPKTLALYAAPLVVLFVVELAMYGHIVPRALHVKSLVYDFPLTRSVKNTVTFRALADRYIGAPLGLCFLLLVGSETFVICRRHLRIDFHEAFVIFAGAMFSAWAIGRSLVFPWYHCLLVFPAGLFVLTQDKTTTSVQERMAVPLTVIALIGFALLGTRNVVAMFSITGSDTSNYRVSRYLAIGQELYSICPSCTVVSSEVGGLGYSFKGRVYDAFGLGDPEALRFHPMRVPEEREDYAIGAIPPAYVDYRNPDFVVSMPMFSAAFRASARINSFFVYDCPFPDHIVIFRDAKIQIFAKTALPDLALRSIACELAARPVPP